MQLNEVMLRIAELGEAVGVQSIKDLPGLWAYTVDENWRFEVNGHSKTLDGLDPFWGRAFYREIPAGVFNAFDGFMAAGQAVNESTFIEALNAAIARARDN